MVANTQHQGGRVPAEDGWPWWARAAQGGSLRNVGMGARSRTTGRTGSPQACPRTLGIQGCSPGLVQGSLSLHDLGVHLGSCFLSLAGAGLRAGRRGNEGLELLRSVLAH
eukprot:2873282-Rhodomonas_salina.1